MKHSDRLLVYLKDAGDNFVSGEDLSKRLEVSRTAVWKEIQTLKGLGYRIIAATHRGYRLRAVPDKLFADEIQYGLKTKIIGRRVFSYEDLDSTNDAAWKLGEQGLPEGACVFAEHQKKGRGRLGRAWNSPKGQGILMSVLLRPPIEPSAVSRVTLASALAVIRAVRAQTGLELSVKWPNDVVYKDRKLCGILTEMSAEMDRVRFVVVGLGLNVNARAKDLPPGGASLRGLLGKKVERARLARRILEELEVSYERLKAGRHEALCEEWESCSQTTGRRVVARLLNRTVHGLATGIDADGALWIRHDNGLQERILSGDVQQVRPSPSRRLKHVRGGAG